MFKKITDILSKIGIMGLICLALMVVFGMLAGVGKFLYMILTAECHCMF